MRYLRTFTPLISFGTPISRYIYGLFYVYRLPFSVFIRCVDYGVVDLIRFTSPHLFYVAIVCSFVVIVAGIVW